MKISRRMKGIKTRISDDVKTSKESHHERKLNDFQSLYSEPQSLDLKNLLEQNSELNDLSGISVINHYLLATEKFYNSEQNENYLYLIDNLNNIFQYVFEKFPEHNPNALPNFLLHLGKNKNYDFILIILKKLKNVKISINEKTEIFIDFVLENKLLKNNLELINQIYEEIKMNDSLRPLLERQEEKINFKFGHKMMMKLLKEKNFDALLELFNDIDQISADLSLINEARLIFIKKFIDLGDGILLEKLFKITNERNVDVAIKINSFLNSKDNILIYAIKKGNLNVVEIILKEINNSINKSYEIKLKKENFVDNKNNNLFHFIADLKSENRERIFEKLILFFENLNLQFLLNELLNSENNFKFLPLHLLLLNFREEDLKLIKNVLGMTQICTEKYSGENDEIYLNQIIKKAFDQNTLSKSKKNQISKYFIHPSEVLCLIGNKGQFNEALQFLNENNLFNPFIINKLKSSFPPTTVFHDLLKKNLNEKSIEIIFKLLQQKNEEITSNLIQHFYYVNIFDFLDFFNKNKDVLDQTIVLNLVNSYIKQISEENENIPKKYKIINNYVNKINYKNNNLRILNENNFKIIKKIKREYNNKKTEKVEENIKKLTENFAETKNINNSKLVSSLKFIENDNKLANEIFLFSTIKKNPLIEFLNSVNDEESFVLLLNTLIISTHKDFIFKTIKILIRELNPLQVSFVLEILQRPHSNEIIINDKFKINEDPKFFLSFVNNLNKLVFNNLSFDKWLNLFYIYINFVQQFPVNYQNFIKLHLYKYLNYQNFNNDESVDKNLILNVLLLKESKNKNKGKSFEEFKLALIIIYLVNDINRKNDLFDLLEKALKNERNYTDEKIKELKIVLCYDRSSDLQMNQHLLVNQSSSAFSFFEEKLQNNLQENFLMMMNIRVNKMIQFELANKISKIVINLLKKDKNKLNEHLKNYLSNFYDNLYSLVKVRKELNEKEIQILQQNFIDINKIKLFSKIRNINLNRNENVFDIFYTLISDKNLEFLFSSNEVEFSLHKQFINNYLNNNRQHKQLLISHLHNIPQNMLEGIHLEDSKSLVSFNIFSFISQYQNDSFNRYQNFLNSILERDSNSQSEKLYSHYTQINAKNLNKESESVKLSKFANNLESFINDCNTNNFNLNQILENKSYSECFAKIIYTIIIQNSKSRNNLKLLNKILLLCINFPTLFDYKNEWNRKLLLITVKTFTKFNFEQNNKNLFLSNVIDYPFQNNLLYDNLESLNSSICFITNELLKMKDLEFFDLYAKNLLKIVNADKPDLVKFLLKNGFLSKLFFSYYIFTDDIQNLKTLENVTNLQDKNEYLQKFDLKNYSVYISIKLQNNNFTKFLHKFNNSTLFNFSIISNNNSNSIKNVFSYLKDEFTVNSFLDEEKLNLKFDLIKCILISKNFNLITLYNPLIKDENYKNYYDTISSYYRGEKEYINLLKQLTTNFPNLKLHKLFLHCIINDNFAMSELILNDVNIDEIIQDFMYVFELTGSHLINLLVIKNKTNLLKIILNNLENPAEILKNLDGLIEKCLFNKSYETFIILYKYFTQEQIYDAAESLYKSDRLISQFWLEKSSYKNNNYGEFCDFIDSEIINENSPELNRNLKVILELDNFTDSKKVKNYLFSCPKFISLNFAEFLMKIQNKNILSLLLDTFICKLNILPEENLYNKILENPTGEEFILQLFYYLEKAGKCIIPVMKSLDNNETNEYISTTISINDSEFVFKNKIENSIFDFYVKLIKNEYTKLIRICSTQTNILERSEEFVNYCTQNLETNALFSVIKLYFSSENILNLYLKNYNESVFNLKFKNNTNLENDINQTCGSVFYTNLYNLESFNIPALDNLYTNFKNSESLGSEFDSKYVSPFNLNFFLFLTSAFNPNNFTNQIMILLNNLNTIKNRKIIKDSISDFTKIFRTFNVNIKFLTSDEMMRKQLNKINNVNYQNPSETYQKLFDSILKFYNDKLISMNSLINISFLDKYFSNYINSIQGKLDLVENDSNLSKVEIYLKQVLIYNQFIIDFIEQIQKVYIFINKMKTDIHSVKDVLKDSFEQEGERRNNYLNLKKHNRKQTEKFLGWSHYVVTEKENKIDNTKIISQLKNYSNVLSKLEAFSFIETEDTEFINKIRESNSGKLSDVICLLLNEMKYNGKIISTNSKVELSIPIYFDKETLIYRENFSDSKLDLVQYYESLLFKISEIKIAFLPFSNNPLAYHPELFGEMKGSNQKLEELVESPNELTQNYARLLLNSYTIYTNLIVDETEWFKYSLMIKLSENDMKLSIQDEKIQILLIKYLQITNSAIDQRTIINFIDNPSQLGEIELFLNNISNYEVRSLKDFLNLKLFNLSEGDLDGSIFFNSHQRFNSFFKELSKKIEI